MKKKFEKFMNMEIKHPAVVEAILGIVLGIGLAVLITMGALIAYDATMTLPKVELTPPGVENILHENIIYENIIYENIIG